MGERSCIYYQSVNVRSLLLFNTSKIRHWWRAISSMRQSPGLFNNPEVLLFGQRIRTPVPELRINKLALLLTPDFIRD